MNIQKKYIILSTIILIAVATIVYIIILFHLNLNIKYNLDDCVTYFDNEARYQLIEIDNYFIVDKKKETTLFTNVTKYAFQDEILYVEFNEFAGYSGEAHHDNEIHICMYGIYNLHDESKVVVKDITDFSKKNQSIFNNEEVMIKLDSNINSWNKHFSELIPSRLRKK